MKFRIKDTKTTIRIIAIYQIIGGTLGLGLIGWLLLRTGQINGPLLFIFCLAFFLFGLSIHSGNLLLKEGSLKTGLIFSSILQGLQIISIGISRYTYEFFSGVKTTIGVDFTNGFEFNASAAFSTFTFNLNSSDINYFIKINILAIIVLSILIDIYEELYKKKTIKETNAAEPRTNDDVDLQNNENEKSFTRLDN